MVVNAAVLQKTAKLETPHTEETGGSVERKFLGPIAFDSKCFERFATGVWALSDVIGQLDSNLHDVINITGPRALLIEKIAGTSLL